jgi:D-threo-aldose 1-dehydrogenase
MSTRIEHAALARVALAPVQPLARGAAARARLGFGSAPLGNLFTPVEDAAAEAAIHAALDAGIELFDTAPFYGYGLSERRLGAALARRPPGSVAISTKVGRRLIEAPGHEPSEGYRVSGYRAQFDYSRAAVLESFEGSLTRLRRDRVDLLLLHDIGRATHGDRHAQMLRQALDEALPAMQRLKEMHACRAIGIGVNENAVCLEIMQSFDLDCILLAGRYTLLEQSSLEDVVPEALRRGVGILIGGAFNSGLLAEPHAPGRTYNYEAVDSETLARAQRLYAICAQHAVDVGAAALQFVLAHPAVIGVAVGMRSVAEVRSTLARMDAAIPAQLWQALREAGILRPDAPTP